MVGHGRRIGRAKAGITKSAQFFLSFCGVSGLIAHLGSMPLEKNLAEPDIVSNAAGVPGGSLLRATSTPSNALCRAAENSRVHRFSALTPSFPTMLITKTPVSPQRANST